MHVSSAFFLCLGHNHVVESNRVCKLAQLTLGVG